MLNGNRSIKDVMEKDHCRSLNVMVTDWYDYNLTNLDPLFSIFGCPINISDLHRDGCTVKVKKKRFGLNPSSLKVVFYHPKYRMAFTFSVPSVYALPVNYMNMTLRHLVHIVANKRWFTGIHTPDGHEAFEKKIFVPVDREMGDLELLNKVNQQILDRLGNRAWTKTETNSSFEEVA